uniref:Putative secreted protein n=1 Tax=Anopheles triannulatus TaxID=58253 RepID=A0A2M4B5V9_9DIPT
MKSKCSKSLIPIVLSWSTVVARFVRCISGTGVGSISSRYARSVYNRYALPGPVRPARPARCLAAAWEMGVTTSESMPVFELYTFCLTNPGSTT